jgi:hypothetical protein
MSVRGNVGGGQNTQNEVGSKSRIFVTCKGNR